MKVLIISGCRECKYKDWQDGYLYLCTHPKGPKNEYEVADRNHPEMCPLAFSEGQIVNNSLPLEKEYLARKMNLRPGDLPGLMKLKREYRGKGLDIF